uniref:BHLH domain-containing protein n=1 Tax=Kalanchoe fedtschenkoi TaxID=63787 RepID=A0A7N0T4H1_KALFE
MEDPSLINQWMMMSSYEDLSAVLPPAMSSAAAASSDDDHLQHSLLYRRQLTAVDDFDHFNNRPAKQLKASSWGSSCEPMPSPETQNKFSEDYFSTVNPPQFTINRLDYPVWDNENTYVSKPSHLRASGTNSAATRSSGAQNHIMAERKRRENLTQLFIALSALVPGLKKMDKASVLAETVKHLKQLQDRIKTLEDQIKSNKATDSRIRNPSVFSGEMFVKGAPDWQLPEIDARVCGRSVLIRIIHCDKNKEGVIEKTLSEVAKLGLAVVSSNVLAFGGSALHITIVAKMDAECCKTAEELVRTLRAAFMDFV